MITTEPIIEMTAVNFMTKYTADTRVHVSPPLLFLSFSHRNMYLLPLACSTFLYHRIPSFPHLSHNSTSFVVTPLSVRGPGVIARARTNEQYEAMPLRTVQDSSMFSLSHSLSRAPESYFLFIRQTV